MLCFDFGRIGCSLLPPPVVPVPLWAACGSRCVPPHRPHVRAGGALGGGTGRNFHVQRVFLGETVASGDSCPCGPNFASRSASLESVGSRPGRGPRLGLSPVPAAARPREAAGWVCAGPSAPHAAAVWVSGGHSRGCPAELPQRL